MLDDVSEREIVAQERDLEQDGREDGHHGSRVERATPDLDESVALPPTGPEAEQCGEAAHHDSGQQRACAQVAEDHDAGGPPHIRGIGGRSQGDAEHARERIA